jgi:hypothetical protein
MILAVFEQNTLHYNGRYWHPYNNTYWSPLVKINLGQIVQAYYNSRFLWIANPEGSRHMMLPVILAEE